MNKCQATFALLSIFLLYAFISIFTKYTSIQETFSFYFFLGLAGVFVLMGVYAILWQQVLKRIPLADAYMFKGSSLIFLLILSAILFDENITVMNIIGSLLIIVGIVLFAKS